MYSDDYLKSIGFRPFVFLKKDERDGIKRLTWVHSFGSGNWLTVRVKYLDNKWEVDMTKVEGDETKRSYSSILEKKEISEIISLISKISSNSAL